MSLLLLDSSVNTAVNSQLSINLLSRQRASVHAVSVVDLPVTACFLGQGRSTVLSFVILEEDLGFAIILGSQWDLWCSWHKGKQKYAVFLIVVFHHVTIVPCPLRTVNVLPDMYHEFIYYSDHLNNDNDSQSYPSCSPICVIFVGSHHPSQDWLRHHATPLIVRHERIRLLLYGSRLITIYIVMTSVCETVVGIAARRPSVTLSNQARRGL